MEYLTDQDYETALKNGIGKKQAYQRFYRYNWSKRRAISEPIQTQKSDIQWEKWEETCLKNGINYYTFRSRIRLGWTHEKAASIPVDASRKVRRGKITEEHLVRAARNGISEQTLRSRVNTYRWPIEKAVTLPVGTRLKKGWG